ncbi:hypothetical protein BZG36_03547 [Bifiguratus adelaidae]|uniref:choline-phosphate cytidylyltransferase n=1 Tax=Bifiguratus adelaidae TaxID=1938954 RepID=A0A261XZ75_9FUNG|nr:hypothetical protein BZG36_03547 [Bifiguratus adelaidae]
MSAQYQPTSRDASDEDNTDATESSLQQVTGPSSLAPKTNSKAPMDWNPRSSHASDKKASSLEQALPAPESAYPFKINPPPTDRPVRVYCDGIYDLFHFGHARALEQAKKAFPNVYLLVGVCNDIETHKRKGKTVMKDTERYEAVRHCRWVDEVVPNAPWTVTQEFLDKHQIDYVAHDAVPYGSSDSEDVYAFVKSQGKFLPTARTEGVSTSDLITRIVRDYDSYLRRNLERGMSAKELNISFFKEQELRAKHNIHELRDAFRQGLFHNIDYWESKTTEFIRGFAGYFGAEAMVERYLAPRRSRGQIALTTSSLNSRYTSSQEDDYTKSDTDAVQRRSSKRGRSERCPIEQEDSGVVGGDERDIELILYLEDAEIADEMFCKDARQEYRIECLMWDFVTGVLSTQSLLLAIGLGAGSIPLAASLNWIIKDGLGQLGGVLYAAFVGSKFDADPKRYRFHANNVFQAASFIELLTPLVPGAFLVLASASNIGKNMAWLASSASRAHMHKQFALQNNLGDVTAKSGSQGTAAGLLGTALSIAITSNLSTSAVETVSIIQSTSALTAWFIPFSTLSIYASYRSNLCVSTVTFNQLRFEMIVHRAFTKCNIKSPTLSDELAAAVETACQFSQADPFAWRSPRAYQKPLILEPSFGSILSRPDGAQQLARAMKQTDLCQSERYFLLSTSKRVMLWFSMDANVQDVYKGLYHACLLRELGTSISNAHHLVNSTFDAFLGSLKQKGWDSDMIKQRLYKGSRAEDCFNWSTPSLEEIESAFALQEYLQGLIRHDHEDLATLLKTPKDQDSNVWQYEHVRAIDYIVHTLDGATALLNSNRYFPGRLSIPEPSVKHLTSTVRRLYRIFAHAYFSHRELFEQYEMQTLLYARFVGLTQQVHKKVPKRLRVEPFHSHMPTDPLTALVRAAVLEEESGRRTPSPPPQFPAAVLTARDIESTSTEEVRLSKVAPFFPPVSPVSPPLPSLPPSRRTSLVPTTNTTSSTGSEASLTEATLSRLQHTCTYSGPVQQYTRKSFQFNKWKRRWMCLEDRMLYLFKEGPGLSPHRHAIDMFWLDVHTRIYVSEEFGRPYVLAIERPSPELEGGWQKWYTDVEKPEYLKMWLQHCKQRLRDLREAQSPRRTRTMSDARDLEGLYSEHLQNLYKPTVSPPPTISPMTLTKRPPRMNPHRFQLVLDSIASKKMKLQSIFLVLAVPFFGVANGAPTLREDDVPVFPIDPIEVPPTGIRESQESAHHSMPDIIEDSYFKDASSLRDISNYVWSPTLPAKTVQLYRPQGQPPAEQAGLIQKHVNLSSTSAPASQWSKNCKIRRITDPAHPCCGAYGLFANTTLAPKQHVLDYIGQVCGDDYDKSSDYVLRFGDLSVDAGRMGNEARFVNDFRGVDKKPNVCFLNYIDQHHHVRVGVFVLDRKVRKGQELLVTYGKSFWQQRGLDLEAMAL